MTSLGQIVKCVKADGDILKEGELYTVVSVTENGNYILGELNPPSPHTSFNKDRFEFEAELFYEDFFFEDEELQTNLD